MAEVETAARKAAARPDHDAAVREMLCLAGLAYRGFNDAAVSVFHTDAVRRAITQGLNTLSPLGGAWELVWGPAFYRAPLSLLDDELMYVVRNREAPHRYVVAIRGTNPVSAFDWVFGDLWAGRQTRWPYGDGSARVSLSTALGLAILKGLRSDGPRDDASAALWQAVDARMAAIPEVARGVLGWLADLAEPAIAPLRYGFAKLLEGVARHRSLPPADDADAHIRALAALWTSKMRALMIEFVARAAGLFSDRLDLTLLALLEDEVRLRESLGAGSDVVTFLAGAVECTAGPVEIVVTGHSKGGALASTVALWLAETQGRQTPLAERWDSGRRAKVHCYSYAGPTAGNAAFAARSNALIGPRCHRIANRLDIVPHAWALADLETIPTLYDSKVVAGLPGLGDLIATIAAVTKALEYCHVGNLVTELQGTVDSKEPLFVPQFVHQHMQAYLDLLGLTKDGIDTMTLLDPLAVLP